jgi:hypothetical protein
MGMIGETLSLDRELTDRCDCLWGRNECPNEAATIVKNRDNAGFSIMCEVHTDGFRADFASAPVEYLTYSRELAEQLTIEAKAAGLT